MPRPNILQILVDDMGYGDFGVFNDGLSRTPALDRLVEESVCLTQHYAASPVCNPSRAALLTGRYPHRTGSIDTLDWRGLDRLALREVTLADMLKKEGYATGLVGKWHLGALDARYHPNARGFDEFVGFCGGWQPYYRWRLDRNGSFHNSDGSYLTDVFTNEAIEFLRRHSNEPFFLHLAYNAPHDPLEAPEEEVAPFLETGQFTRGVSILYGMIQRMDKGVARVLEELKRLGIEDNTLVLFTSDNGPQFGGHGEMCHDRFNCGFNGSKGYVYEGGIRVPMIARWPDGLDGGRHFDEMVHFTDWLPTLLAAAGLDPPGEVWLDGQNILPVLRGEGGKVQTRRFWQWNRYTPLVTCNAAMRDGDWKLVRPHIQEAFHIPSDDMKWNDVMRYQPQELTHIITDPEPPREVPPPGPPKLFNIAEDPLEKNDLAHAEPQRTSKMLRELETWFEQVEAERATIADVP